MVTEGFRFTRTHPGRESQQHSGYLKTENGITDSGDNPFFVDFLEEDRHFPVYFSWHDMDWTPMNVAESLNQFTSHLLNLKEIENDSEKVKQYIIKNFDLSNNEFWNEVVTSILEWEQDNQE